MTARKLTIEVTPWPSVDHFDPADPRYQWDVYEDVKFIAGGTGPAGLIGHAYYGIEAYQEYLNDASAGDR